jgi:hypothetical protein
MLEIEQSKVDAILRGIEKNNTDKEKLEQAKKKLLSHKQGVRYWEKRVKKSKEDVEKNSFINLCDRYNISVNFMLKMVEMNKNDY